MACSNSGILLRWFECLVSGCVVILGTDKAVGYVEGVTVVLPGRKYAIEASRSSRGYEALCSLITEIAKNGIAQ